MGFGKVFGKVGNLFTQNDQKAELRTAQVDLERDRAAREIEIAKADALFKKTVADTIDGLMRFVGIQFKNRQENSGFEDTNRNNYTRFL